MLFFEGLSCPVCHRPFVNSDDIVSCPQCGLPHHRECWHQVGHCHAEHLHNTEHQWSRTVEQPPVNQQPSEPPYQAAPQESYHEYKPFSQFEAPHPHFDVNDTIDGISANDYAVVVGTKTEYYIPRFRRVAAGQNGGWNWAAFFFGAYWLIYRKMYLGGVLLLILNLFNTFLSTFVLQQLNITDPEQLYDAFYMILESASVNGVQQTQLFYLLSIWIMSAIIFTIDILLAVYANQLYQQHCANVIRKNRMRCPDLSSPELTGIGGTNIGVVLICGVLVSFIEQIIGILFM